MTEKLAEILQELRQELESMYGDRLVQLVLYGSQARGDADAESDIDVLVVLSGELDYGAEIERTSYLTSDLSLKYDVVLSRIFVQEDRYDKEQSPFLINVRREGVLI